VNKILFVTRPKYDEGTAYLSYYASLILKKSSELQVATKSLDKEMAQNKEAIKFLKKKNPKLLFLNGHGDEENIYGHKDLVLFSKKDMNFLKNKIIYARACNAAISLGKEIVKGNTGCFIGYKYPFSFWLDETWNTNPSKDKTAKLFLAPSNEIMDSLLKGNTTDLANKKSKKMMVSNMRKIVVMNNNNTPGAMQWLKTLWTNYQGQVLHGNSKAVFD